MPLSVEVYRIVSFCRHFNACRASRTASIVHSNGSAHPGTLNTISAMERHYTPLDRIIAAIDEGLRVSTGEAPEPFRPNPAGELETTELDDRQRTHAAGLMRINHTGEVCAQALYQGQSLTSRNQEVKEKLREAALEENDHLDWTKNRLVELGSHTSLLNPLWYAGSFAIGAAAGIAGDKWSLGFVMETEKQVISHIDDHLKRISQNDSKSRAILGQRKIDEAHHGATAKQAGGAELPAPVRQLMKLTSRVMTGTAYWI